MQEFRLKKGAHYVMFFHDHTRNNPFVTTAITHFYNCGTMCQSKQQHHLTDFERKTARKLTTTKEKERR